MMLILLTVNPTLAAWGLVAAIIICICFSIFVLLTLFFNAALAWLSNFMSKKAELIKELRPRVNSINQTVEHATQGEPVSPDANPILRTVARVPATINAVDQRVESASSRVSEAAIEFHARTQQAKIILKAFFLPGLMRPAPKKRLGEQGLEFQSPGYRMLIERDAAEIPIARETTDTARIKEELRPLEAPPEPAPVPPEPVMPAGPPEPEALPAQTVTTRTRQRNNVAKR